MKDKKIGRAEVIEKFGVPPEKVIEVQALIGDSTDNVPGVPGIGVKTAAQLIGEYGDLETLLKRAGEIKQEKRRQTLIDNAEKARLSKKLVTLDDQRQARRADRRSRRARARLQAADRLSQGDGVQRADAPRRGVCRASTRPRSSRMRGSAASGAASASPAAEERRRSEAAPVRRNVEPQLPLGRPPQPADARRAESERRRARLRRRRSPPRGSRARRAKNSTARNTKPCATLDRLKAWIERARDIGFVAIDTETDESRSDAGGAVRLLAGAGGERGLLRAAVASPRAAASGKRRLVPAASVAPDQISEARRARRRSSRCSKTRACSRSART